MTPIASLSLYIKIWKKGRGQNMCPPRVSNGNELYLIFLRVILLFRNPLTTQPLPPMHLHTRLSDSTHPFSMKKKNAYLHKTLTDTCFLWKSNHHNTQILKRHGINETPPPRSSFPFLHSTPQLSYTSLLYIKPP